MFSVRLYLLQILLTMMIMIINSFGQKQIYKFDTKEHVYPFMAVIIHKKNMSIGCAGVVVGNNGEILVTADCMDK